MGVIGNILWFVLGGFLMGLAYMVSGLALCLTIVGIPFGLRTIKLGLEVMLPFGKDVKEIEGANSPLRLVFNVLWLVLFGWEIALGHAVLALIFALTIVGLPFAYQHLKIVPLSLFPFGRDFVDAR